MEFVEFLLSQKPEFVAEKLRPAYMAYVREFLDCKEKHAGAGETNVLEPPGRRLELDINTLADGRR